MLLRTVLLLSIAALASCQYHGDPREAAILEEQRYLSNDGKFGASYSQEDGVEFKEEADPDGTRRGQYSWVDPSGQRRTVSYTAGKHGFQASGDHLPSGPSEQPQYPPQQQYQPQPQYQPPPQQYQSQPQPRPQYQPQQQYQPQTRPQYQPQQQYQPQTRPQQYQPQQQPQQQYQPQPQPRPQPVYSTTSAPHRFYPPGKLSLNRSPDGFSYTFNKS